MRMRGAKPSPRHRLAGARPHIATMPAPAQWLWKPVRLSMWGNDTYGDCTVAEEAFVKAVTPGIFIPDNEVIAWAQTNGAIDGDTLIDVLDKMQTGGFAFGGKTEDDGAPISVDWTNYALLTNAIAQGPVKLGVAADQLESTVPEPPTNGWLGVDFSQDPNMDHCTSACGYGPIAWLLSEISGTLPAGPYGTQPGIAMFTWDSVGVLDWPSFLAITGEAWLRQPTTVTK